MKTQDLIGVSTQKYFPLLFNVVVVSLIGDDNINADNKDKNNCKHNS
ncbi:14650_t:CDS:2 [Entrophospora sp. SA101]|nr:14650_t:CDS:2 [Entrophospora sp. SA101]